MLFMIRNECFLHYCAALTKKQCNDKSEDGELRGKWVCQRVQNITFKYTCMKRVKFFQIRILNLHNKTQTHIHPQYE